MGIDVQRRTSGQLRLDVRSRRSVRRWSGRLTEPKGELEPHCLAGSFAFEGAPMALGRIRDGASIVMELLLQIGAHEGGL
jgi:hypothetical protein